MIGANRPLASTRSEICAASRRDLPILTPRKSDQHLTRHLLQRGHSKIELQPPSASLDQHANPRSTRRSREISRQALNV